MIQLSKVSKSVGPNGADIQVLNELDLTVGVGEIVAIAGPSGSGKTTILALLAGWVNSASGHVTVIDDTISLNRRPWSDVAVIPQSLGLLPELTIGENITLPLTATGIVATTSIDSLTDQLGLTHLTERHPDEVSLGEQQRAAIARAAIAQPKVLLADEPIAHQNHQRAHDVMNVISTLALAGTAVLIATHNELAFDYSHRTLHLTAGTLRSEPTPRPAVDRNT